MLPTCPACKQSVLDDDATECPFCGANMKSGKGGAAKPTPSKPSSSAAKSSPSPAADPKPAAAKPSSKPAGKPASASSKSMLDDDDDPFASSDDDDPFAAATKQDADSKSKAIAVSVKKTKTHVVELKCPMCDTVGFVPENSSGKDVKCSNPKCTVPVFMAPKNYGAPAPIAAPVKTKAKKSEPTGPSKKPLILAIVGGVALVAAVGLAVLFWPDTSGPGPAPVDFKGLAEKARQERLAKGLPDPTTIAGTPQKDEAADAAAQQKAAAPPIDVVSILKLMEDYSLEDILVNKRYCRLRTAIGYATVGDVAGMRSQFAKLDEIESTLQHFKIPALMTMGWQQMAAADKSAAAKTADEAVKATVKVGKGSRDTQGPMIDLAALLVATDRTAEAKKLLADHLVPDASTRLIVALGLARHRGDFDLERELPGAVGNPQRAWAPVGVTLVLAREGLWDAAQNWADSVADVEARTDCQITWADARTRAALGRKETVDPSVEAAAAKLSPGGKVQFLARLALTHATAGQAADATRLAAAAQEALKAIPVPAMARCDGFKEALDWKTPDTVALRQAVLGAAAIGQAQAKLTKKEDAWNSTIEALKFARGMAPSPAAVANVKEAAESMGLEPLRDKIRALLMLRSRDEAVRKTRELSNKLDSLAELAAERFHLQEAVLQGAVAAGLAPQVWSETLSLSQRSDANELESYLSGPLSRQLVERFTADGLTTEAADVNAKLEELEVPPDELFDLRQMVAAAVKNNDLNSAIKTLSQRRLAGESEEVAMQGFMRAAKQPDQAVTTLKQVQEMDIRTNNQFFKYEALRMLAAFAARNGDFAGVQSAIQNQRASYLERISIYLGLLEGYTAWKNAQPAPVVEVEAAANSK